MKPDTKRRRPMALILATSLALSGHVLAQTAIEFPPMQKGASFNLDAVKAKIEAARAAIAK